MMADSIFITLTLGFGLLSLTLIMLLVGLFLFARAEGRYFLTKGLSGKGIDVIRHEPVSNDISLESITWNGQYFKLGKEALFYGIERILNPDDDPKKMFNEFISKGCKWKGNKRPVIISTDTMSFAVTPAFFSLIAKAPKHKEYETIARNIEKLKSYLDEEIEIVTYFEIIKPDEITEFLNDVGPRKLMDAFNKGVNAEKLKNTKPRDMGMGTKIAISATVLLIIVAALFAWQSGLFDNALGKLCLVIAQCVPL